VRLWYNALAIKREQTEARLLPSCFEMAMISRSSLGSSRTRSDLLSEGMAVILCRSRFSGPVSGTQKMTVNPVRVRGQVLQDIQMIVVAGANAAQPSQYQGCDSIFRV
jgi:hypothetical protein